MIIGLAGVKRSGKNTVANFIADRYGDDYKVSEWAFAEDLKKSAAHALGQFDREVEFCDLLKEKNSEITIVIKGKEWGAISGREFLQWYGTEAHRDVFGPNFWVNNLIEKIYNDQDGELHHGQGDVPRLDLITDVRFPNEAEVIRGACGGKVIQIIRPEVEDSGDSHASEKPLDPSLIDGVIYNENGLDKLRHSTYLMIQEICKEYLVKNLSKKVPYA